MEEKREPVSVNWQTVFMFIPLVAVYALIRIEKFRLGLLYFIPLNLGTGILGGIFIGMPDEGDSALGVLILVSIGLGIYFSGIVVMIKLIRKWSREWNESISENS